MDADDNDRQPGGAARRDNPILFPKGVAYGYREADDEEQAKSEAVVYSFNHRESRAFLQFVSLDFIVKRLAGNAQLVRRERQVAFMFVDSGFNHVVFHLLQGRKLVFHRIFRFPGRI